MALTPAWLEGLLAAFDPADRERAGHRYELVRRKLLIFFAARRCSGPAEDFADETLDRAARRIAEGVDLDPSPESFILGVARNVLREQWKKVVVMRTPEDWDRVAAPQPEQQPDEDGAAACLEQCLAKLAPQSRQWIERFYEHSSGGEKIASRKRLAAELGIDTNALRVRMHRIRAVLEKCIRACLAGNETAKGAIPERD